MAEAEQLLRDKRIGPLEGFRSKAGWPFTSEIVIKYDDEAHNYKLEFDFGDDGKGEETGELVEFTDASLGACPICGAPVHEHGSNYVCSKAVPTAAQPTPSCTFKSGKIILQQPVEREQMTRLLSEGKTGLLEKFISNRTRRARPLLLPKQELPAQAGQALQPKKPQNPQRRKPRPRARPPPARPPARSSPP